MNTSSSIVEIAPALLKAQTLIGAVKKESVNPFFHSTYADLGAVMEVCKNALNDNGIVVLQPVGKDESGAYVETILLHESGEYISDKMPIVVKESNNPQAQGSAITYARRYGLQSMVFIPAEDDDANSATETKTQDDRPKLTPDLKVVKPDQECLKCGGMMEYREGMKGNKWWAGYFCRDKECGNVSWVNRKQSPASSMTGDDVPA